MSKWDWLHAGLESAIYLKTQQTQQIIKEMKTGSEREAELRAVAENRRNEIFAYSRDIQLIEDRLAAQPLQVYILSMVLNQCLSESGLSAAVFHDLQDKEYTFQVKRKIVQVIEKSKNKLSNPQIQQADTAVQYIIEMPLLLKAIDDVTARQAMENLRTRLMKLNQQRRVKKLLFYLGITGLVTFACIGIPLSFAGLGFLLDGDIYLFIKGLLLLCIAASISLGAILFLVLGSKSSPEYESLIAQNKQWQQQLMPAEVKKQAISAFGNLNSEALIEIKESRIAFLETIIGNNLINSKEIFEITPDIIHIPLTISPTRSDTALVACSTLA